VASLSDFCENLCARGKKKATESGLTVKDAKDANELGTQKSRKGKFEKTFCLFYLFRLSLQIVFILSTFDQHQKPKKIWRS